MTLGFKEVSDKPYGFDLDFAGNGDPLKNAIYMSLFCNKKEISPEFLNKNIAENGWFGNLIVHNGTDFDQGSFLWTLKQVPLDDETINLALAYTEESLQWLIDDEVIEDFNVSFVDKNNVLLPEESTYNYIKKIGYIILEIAIKPFHKNEIKYSLNIKNGWI